MADSISPDMFEQLAWTKNLGIGPNICHSFFDWYSSQSMLDALDWLASYIAKNGPYDGIISFSQTTCLASTFLLHHQQLYPDLADPVFRCAIFFQGILPLDVGLLQRGRRRQVGVVSEQDAKYCDDASSSEEEDDDSADEFQPLHIPTTHVWGTNDTFPLAQGEQVSKLFTKQLRINITHQEGHAIPGARNMDGVRKIVRAIRKTVERADMMH